MCRYFCIGFIGLCLQERPEPNLQKGDKLYIKWKGYDNSFNSWIDKKRLN